MKKLCIACVVTLFTVFSAPSQARDLPDFTELVETQGAAVVNISTTQVIKQNPMMQQMPFDEDDPAQEFFRRFFPGQIPGMPPGYPGRPA